jgi:hypothetical protein
VFVVQYTIEGEPFLWSRNHGDLLDYIKENSRI